MLPAFETIEMSNSEVLHQLQRILDSENVTIPANITAQLLFAAVIELSRRVDTYQIEAVLWRTGAEKRLDMIDALSRSHSQMDEEKEKSRVNIRDVMSRLVEPVVVAIVTALLFCV